MRPAETALALVVAILVGGGAEAHLLGPPPTHGSASRSGSTFASPQRAVRFFAERVATNPRDQVAWITLARLHREAARSSGDPAGFLRAERALRRGRALTPERPVATLALAGVLYDQHRFLEAREHLRMLEVDGPDGIAALALRGDVAMALGDYDRGRADYHELGRRRPDDPAVLARLVSLRELEGDLDGALALALLAERLADGAGSRAEGGEEGRSWYALRIGELRFMRGELALAARRFTAVLAARPDTSAALVGLAKIQSARGALVEAAVLLESAAATHPDPVLLATRGDIAERMGEAAIAEDWWRRAEELALRAGEEQSVYDRQLARFWADHDRRPAEAVAIARREIGSRQDILAADTLAWALFKNGEIAEAAVWSARARRFGTRDPALLYHGARIAWATGDASGALALLDRALAQNSDFDPREAPVARALQRRLSSERASGSAPDTALRPAPRHRAGAAVATRH